MTTQVHKIVLLVVDHDQLGAAGVASELENARYGNDCIGPQVMATETREVEWSDEHPLNHRDKSAAAFAELFALRASLAADQVAGEAKEDSVYLGSSGLTGPNAAGLEGLAEWLRAEHENSYPGDDSDNLLRWASAVEALQQPLAAPATTSGSGVAVGVEVARNAARYEFMRNHGLMHGWFPREVQKLLLDARCTRAEFDAAIDAAMSPPASIAATTEKPQP
jgi:hypothetical protein